jgi:hypothetical protein
MQTSTVAYGTVVTGNDANVALKVTITWPAAVPSSYRTLGDYSVVSCKPNRTTASDMPANTRYVEGVAAADCTITLDGQLDPTDDTKTIAWLLGQYQTTSPMYRADGLGLPVTVDMGVLTSDPTMTTAGYEGVEFVRVFTGVIDDYTVNMQAGTVDLTCLDNRSKLTTAPALPAGVVDYNPYSAGLVQPGLTGQYPMAALLRNGGIYTSPAPRPNLQFFASMHGSVWPEVCNGTVSQAAWLFTRVFTDYVWSAGIFSQQVPNQVQITASLASPISLTVGGGFFIEWWQKATNAQFNYGAHLVLTTSDASSITFDTRDTGASTVAPRVTYVVQGAAGVTATPAITAPTSANNYFAVLVSFPSSTQMTVKTWANGSSATSTVTVPSISTVVPAATLSMLSFGPVEGVQLTTETSPTTWGMNNGFVPTAVLEPSLNLLTALPDVTGQDAWQVIQALAEAEQGIAGFDENGLFAFRNRHSIQSATSVRTIDRNSSLATFTALTAQAQLINHVQIPVNKLSVSPKSWVWSAPDIITVPRGGNYSQVVDCGDPVIALATTDSGRAPAGQSPDGNTYWRACTQPNGAGPEVTTGVTVTAAQIAPTQIRVTITNANAYPIYMVTPIGVGYPSTSNGQPLVLIGGQFVTTTAQAGDAAAALSTSSGVLTDSQFPPLVPDGGAKASPRGEKLLTLPSNVWVQQVITAQAFSDDLLADLCVRRPEWSVTLGIADPRLQRGDRVTVVDPDTTGMTGEDAIVFEIDTDEQWNQTLAMRACAPPGGWILGVAGHSEIGATSAVSTAWVE